MPWGICTQFALDPFSYAAQRLVIIVDSGDNQSGNLYVNAHFCCLFRISLDLVHIGTTVSLYCPLIPFNIYIHGIEAMFNQ